MCGLHFASFKARGLMKKPVFKYFTMGEEFISRGIYLFCVLNKCFKGLACGLFYGVKVFNETEN